MGVLNSELVKQAEQRPMQELQKLVYDAGGARALHWTIKISQFHQKFDPQIACFLDEPKLTIFTKRDVDMLVWVIWRCGTHRILMIFRVFPLICYHLLSL
jgi:hypothetical protein